MSAKTRGGNEERSRAPLLPDYRTVALVNLDVIDKLRIVILPSVSARAYYFGVVSNSLHIIPESNGVTD